MSYLVLENISKTFENCNVVNNINLEIKKGDFVSLLGPSGCGKTTTLRMIAGLEKPSEGSIILNNKTITSIKDNIDIDVKNRNIGMVFQSYALWPHMTVKEILEFPLKIKKINKNEIKEKIKKILKLIRMEDYGLRYPHQLSGGQQQRVSIGRALIADPDLLLMDEPLSNLDAKLREEMRIEIKELQRKTGVTVVYVTHDHAEALSVSDKIAIMLDNSLQQYETPEKIYTQPVNLKVAEFVGNTNLIDCNVTKNHEKSNINILSNNEIIFSIPVEINETGVNLIMMVRPEDIEINSKSGIVSGIIKQKIYSGEHVQYIASVKDLFLKIHSKNNSYHINDQIFLNIEKYWIIH